MTTTSRETSTVTPDRRPLVIDVDHVSKEFTIHVAKSIREQVVSLWRHRNRKRRFRALEDVTLRIHAGETVGLMGHNGSGKSTLLKVIGGIIESSTGAVRYRGTIAALLELGAGFHPDLTGRENIYLNASVLGLSRDDTDRVFDDIVAFSGLTQQFIDTQVKFYSSGMYVRLAFSVAVHSDPEILLVDEVLAVGDERFQVKCLAKIREFQSQGKTIVFVSHSAEQVADVCSRAVVLEAGRVIFDGDVGAGVRALRDSYERSREREAEAAADANPDRVTGASASPVRMLSVEVLDAVTGMRTGIVERGQDIIVRIRARLTERTEWVTGFTFDNSGGHFVYLLNTIGLKMELPQEPGDYQVDFRVNGVNFGARRLVVSAGATSPLGTPFDNLPFGAEFDVAADPNGAGVVQFAVSGEITSTTNAAD